MKETWFNSPDRTLALETEAARWLGTPWVMGSAVPGRGTDCVRLVDSILRNVGALRTFQLPAARSHSSRRLAGVVDLLDAQPEFTRLPEGRELKPGDLLLFSDRHLHFAIVLMRDAVIHSVNPGGVVYGHRHDIALMSRLAAAWFITED